MRERGGARLLLILVTLLAAASPAQARWLEAKSPLFDVYGNGQEQTLRSFVVRLEEYDKFLRLLTHTEAKPSPNRLTIYLVQNADELRMTAPRALEGELGFYKAGPEGVFIVAISSPTQSEWMEGQTIVFHEYTHHFVNQYYPGAYPIWYQEGFAEYCSTVTFDGDMIDFGSPMSARSDPLLYVPWTPIANVLDPPRTPKGVMLSGMFYPESWLITHYLLRSPGRQTQLNRYLAALRQGKESASAFQAAFGMNYSEFQDVLWKYFHSDNVTYSQMRWGKAPAPPPIEVTTLPPSADRLLLLRARLMGEGDARTDGHELLADISAAAKAFPDDPLALRTLARAEIFNGDPEKAGPPLDGLLRAHPDDVEGLYLKGLQMMRKAEMEPGRAEVLMIQARPFFAQAHQIDPNHYPSLYQYALTYARDPQRPSDNTVNILLLAHELAPQVEEISLETARALARVQRVDEARLLLQSVAYQPHPNKTTDEARRQLGELDKPAPAAGASSLSAP